MEVEYVQTVEDHLAFNAHQLASQPLWRRYWMFLAGWLVILVACGALLSAIVPARPTRALEQIWWERSLFFGFVALFSAGALAGKAWSQRNQSFKWVERTVTDPENRKQYLGWRRCSIAPEGVTLRQHEGETTWRWTSVRRVARDDEYVFLYVAPRSAIVVPRSPFASDEEFEKFVETARAYRGGALSAPPDGNSSRGGATAEADTNIRPEGRAGR